MISTGKAYILGLLIGGGRIHGDHFMIYFPFKKWGLDPRTMSVIARDILTRISARFAKEYGFSVGYNIGNDNWSVFPQSSVDLSEMKADLSMLNLPLEGVLLNFASVSKVSSELSGMALEAFVSGVFDTRGSCVVSHRRFSDNAPIVSLEIPGSTQNFKFVVDFCSMLADLGTIADQILYNHPNQHSPRDPIYKGWKKGFKIRFLVSSFLANHSFALRTKSIDAGKLKLAQEKESQPPCRERTLTSVSPVTIHNEIKSAELPDLVRGKLFFHYHHVCAQMGCKHAPIEEVKKLVLCYRRLIFALPRLYKGTLTECSKILRTIRDRYAPGNKIVASAMLVNQALEDTEMIKYREIGEALAFIFADELKGKRPKGTRDIILTENSSKQLCCYRIAGSYLSPILLLNNENRRAALLSAIDGDINQQLIESRIAIDGIEVSVI